MRFVVRDHTVWTDLATTCPIDPHRILDTGDDLSLLGLEFFLSQDPRSAAIPTPVRSFAEKTLLEIDVFQRCTGDYRYVFFLLQPV